MLSINISTNEFVWLRPYSTQKLIRLGSKHDGGYVVCEKSFQDSDHLISFGLGTNIDFEYAYKRKKNQKINFKIYDHTTPVPDLFSITRLLLSLIIKLKLINLINKLNLLLKYFYVNGVKHYDKKVVLDAKNNKEVSIQNIFKQTQSSKIFLKIDIEGDEYFLLDYIIQVKERLVGIVIEFHNVGLRMSQIKHFCQTLSSQLKIVHIHGNNFRTISKVGLPEVIEITFSKFAYAHWANKNYPLRDLDYPNNPCETDIELIFV